MRLRVLGIVLAGGKGTRLYPLTRERAKPAVPFGGKYRIVDFVLSNFINSGIYSIYVLTQFKSQSLLQHLSEGWQFGSLLKNQFIIPVPAQMRTPEETWYQGTADAIYQNVNLIEQADPHVVAIFGADHIYRMNVTSMVEYHEQKRAHVTIAAIPVDKALASEFGVIETASDGRVIGFHEKNPKAPTIPGEPMGAPVYWRDVGTIDAYYEANIDLRSVTPALNLYNREWPLRTASYPDAPAKFTFDDQDRRGQAIDSIVSSACILSGGAVRNSVLFRGVRIHSGALVEESVILDNCDIGRRAKVRRAILDKNVRIPEDAEIGYNLDHDRQYHHVTESGIVVVGGNRSSVDISTLFV